MTYKPDYYNPKHFKKFRSIIEKVWDRNNLPYSKTYLTQGQAKYAMQKLRIYYNVVERDYRLNGESALADKTLQNKPIMKVEGNVLHFRERPKWSF